MADEHEQDERPDEGQVGLPPALAALSTPAATLYADPSVVEPLPEAPTAPLEVATALVGTVEDLPVDGADEAPTPAEPPPAEDSQGSEAPTRRGLLVGLGIVVVLVLAGVLVVLVGGDGEGDQVASGPQAAPSTTSAPATEGEEQGGTDPEPPVSEAPPVTDPPASEAPPVTEALPTSAPTTVPPTAAPTVTVPAPVVPPPAVTVPASPPPSAAPARLEVVPSPMDGSRLVIDRGLAGYLTIRNVGGGIASFTITGGGLSASMPQGTVQAGAVLTVNVRDTVGTDRVTFLDVRGSSFAQRYEVLVR